MTFENTNPTAEQANQIKLGGAIFDQNLSRITLDNRQHSLEPKVSELLALLCSSNKVLSRESILNLLWEDAGSDEALTQTVSKLRRALNDTIRPYQIIETVPKRGYRLLLTPEVVNVNLSSQSRKEESKIISWLSGKSKYPRYVHLLGLFAMVILVFGATRYVAFRGPNVIETELECSDQMSAEECMSLINALDNKARAQEAK